MTLYARVATLLVVFVTISALALSYFSYDTQMVEFKRQRIESAASLTAAIAKSVFADTLEGRRSKVRDTLRGIVKGNAEISYILIIGFDGVLFASTFPDEPPQALMRFQGSHDGDAGSRRFMLDGVEISDFVQPLVDNLEAHIHVGYNTRHFDEFLQQARARTLWLTLGVIVLGLLAANLAAHRIVAPLRRLGEAVSDYASGLPFSRASIGPASPEVDLLVDSFAAMAKQRRRAEQDLHIAASAFETQEAIVITDADTRIVRVNRAFTKITGYPAEAVLGQCTSMFKSGHHDEEFYRQMWTCLLRDGHWSGEIWDRRRNGEAYPKWLTITAVKDPEGNPTHYVGSFIDIAERKAAEARIYRLAYLDPLTNLPNRLSLQERMAQLIALARREKNRIALMLIDLDRFKQVNDTLGHHIGDQLLIQVGNRLSESLRESDILARLGGDEFVVALDGGVTDEAVETLAEKIVAILSQPFHIANHDLHTSPSIGICYFPDHATELDDLIKHADVAMYQAKALGRGRYQFFTPQMQVAVTSRVVMEQELRVALEERQFVLHYQPQLDLRTGRIFGVEALVRWLHPQRGLISPADFIPIAEETGMIDTIGYWVIGEACRQAKDWRERGLPDLSISINLSGGQFLDEALPDNIERLACEAGIPLSTLAFEVTETMAMASPNDTIEALKRLSDLGISLSIDDFGTGYSSLAYLKLFPFDTLKIDRAFVKDIETDEDDAGICDVTVLLAHKLGHDTIAEGVETAGQLHYLLSIGCEKIQGFLISRPLPAEAAEAFIRNHPRMEGLGTVDLWRA